MSIRHAGPGEVIEVGQPEESLQAARTRTLARSNRLEIIRLVMQAGKEIPTHQAPGELIVQCLAGRVEFSAMGQTHTLEPGQLVYLNSHEPHSVRGVEDGVLLLTILLPGPNDQCDDVQEASEGSFPASDPPGWTGANA